MACWRGVIYQGMLSLFGATATYQVLTYDFDWQKRAEAQFDRLDLWAYAMQHTYYGVPLSSHPDFI